MHLLEFCLFVRKSKGFKLYFTTLFIHWISVEIHVTGNIIVDPKSILL